MTHVLSPAQKEKVVEQTISYIQLAINLYQTNLSIISILFDLTRHTIGMYKHVKHGRALRYNATMFGKYFEEKLRGIGSHESANYTAQQDYKNAISNISVVSVRIS